MSGGLLQVVQVGRWVCSFVGKGWFGVVLVELVVVVLN